MPNTPKMRITRSNSTNSNPDSSCENLKTMFASFKNEIIQSFKEEIASLKNSISTLVIRINKLEADNNLLQSKYNDLVLKTNDQSSGINKTCSLVADELKRRDMKEKNLIIYGLPESPIGSVTERENYDHEKCSEIFACLGFTDVAIGKPVRIGKRHDNGKRLLRVTLFNTTQKYEILSQAKRLRHHQRFNGIYVQPDLTHIQRQIQFALRKDLREKRANGEDMTVQNGRLVDNEPSSHFQSSF